MTEYNFGPQNISRGVDKLARKIWPGSFVDVSSLLRPCTFISMVERKLARVMDLSACRASTTTDN